MAGLSSCDPNFPLNFWDCLIPQATLTINLLRPSCLNPRLSAESQLKSAFDYNRTPLAPPATCVFVSEAPVDRGTCPPHGVDRWYLGPAPDHYQCHRVYIPRTRAERIAKTVEFFLTIAPSHPAAPQVPPLLPPAHSPRLSCIPLQPRLHLWRTINLLPSNHSPAFSSTSLPFPQQLLIPWHCAPHLLLLSNPICLHLL